MAVARTSKSREYPPIMQKAQSNPPTPPEEKNVASPIFVARNTVSIIEETVSLYFAQSE